MNNIKNIEIAKRNFEVDQKGYNLINNYLTKLETVLFENDQPRDMYQDIEARLSENLSKISTKAKGKVLDYDTIEREIAKIGTLEQIVKDVIDEALITPKSPWEKVRKAARTLLEKIQYKSAILNNVDNGLALFIAIYVTAAIFYLFYLFNQNYGYPYYNVASEIAGRTLTIMSVAGVAISGYYLVKLIRRDDSKSLSYLLVKYGLFVSAVIFTMPLLSQSRYSFYDVAISYYYDLHNPIYMSALYELENFESVNIELGNTLYTDNIEVHLFPTTGDNRAVLISDFKNRDAVRMDKYRDNDSLTVYIQTYLNSFECFPKCAPTNKVILNLYLNDLDQLQVNNDIQRYWDLALDERRDTPSPSISIYDHGVGQVNLEVSSTYVTFYAAQMESMQLTTSGESGVYLYGGLEYLDLTAKDRSYIALKNPEDMPGTKIKALLMDETWLIPGYTEDLDVVKKSKGRVEITYPDGHKPAKLNVRLE